jgi:hypothetical protein
MPSCFNARGCEAQVVDHRRVSAAGIDAWAWNADEAVQLRHFEDLGIVDRTADTFLELADAIRQAGNAAFAGFPVAGGQVVQHELQTVLLQALGQISDVVRIREQEFDGVKARVRCRYEALEERDFVEQHGEIGCKFRHGAGVSLVGQ